jgi:hypothetical protein
MTVKRRLHERDDVVAAAYLRGRDDRFAARACDLRGQFLKRGRSTAAQHEPGAEGGKFERDGTADAARVRPGSGTAAWTTNRSSGSHVVLAFFATARDERLVRVAGELAELFTTSELGGGQSRPVPEKGIRVSRPAISRPFPRWIQAQ